MEATSAWERRMVVGVTVGLCGVGGEIPSLKTLWVAPNFTREVMSSGSVGRVRGAMMRVVRRVENWGASTGMETVAVWGVVGVRVRSRMRGGGTRAT